MNSISPQSPDTDRRIVRTKKQVAKAVIEILVTQGVTAVNHQEVARKSSVGRATLYRHWPTVPKLIHAAMLEIQLTIDFPQGSSLESDLLHGARSLIDRLSSPLVAALKTLLLMSESEDLSFIQFIQSGVLRFMNCWNYHLPNLPMPEKEAERALTSLAAPIFFRWLFKYGSLTETELTNLVDSVVSNAKANIPLKHEELCIEPIVDYTSVPHELLMLADPSIDLITSYLPSSEIYGAFLRDSLKRDHYHPNIVGVVVVASIAQDSLEIKNLSVRETFQAKGIGTSLLRWLIELAKKRGILSLEIATGNSSFHQLAMYQKLGFRIVAIDKDYFLRNYSEPIMENGIECRDQIRLKLDL